jgi:hypothetical protein
MRIKRFDNFLLESQLIYKGDFKNILYAIRNDGYGSPEAKIADILLELSGVELDLLHNYIKDVTTPGLVSFIPEDKINFDRVSIEQHRIVTKTSLIAAYGIPTEGLLSEGQEKLIGTKDFSNDFKLLKTIDTDLVDLTDEKFRLNGYYLYYLQSNIYPKKFVVVYRSINDSDETPSIYPYDIPENRRSEVKIGRFVNKLIDIYKKSGNDLSIIDNITASDVEKFVNAYTARVLFEQSAFDRFEIVKGEEIKKWYHESNYSGNGGQLNSSCMRFGTCQGYFKIYTENPDVCQLLILKDKTGKKIEGRSLLWTTVDGKKLMDRIYTTKDSLVKLFAKWAEDNSYINKGQETHNYRAPLLDTIVVQVKPKLYSSYPYMDTLIDYVPDKGILCNRIDVETLMKFPDIRKKTRIEDFKKFFTRKKGGSAHFSIDGKDIVIYKLNSVGGDYRLY